MEDRHNPYGEEEPSLGWIALAIMFLGFLLSFILEN
jgi:hypothetical protein